MGLFDKNDIIPPTGTMCARSESVRRQRDCDVSEFEATSATFHLSPRYRAANPALCVTKYRRSAAGGGVSTSIPRTHRNLFRLNETLTYLTSHVFAKGRTYTTTIMPPRTLSHVTSFVDDRLRAVQVDYVSAWYALTGDKEEEEEGQRGGGSVDAATLREGIGMAVRVQCLAVRYNLVTGYLLSSAPSSRFEFKFNAQALRTALAHLVEILPVMTMAQNRQTVKGTMDYEWKMVDEVLCYASLLHTCAVILRGEGSFQSANAGKFRDTLMRDGGAGYSALLSMIPPDLLPLRHCHGRTPSKDRNDVPDLMDKMDHGVKETTPQRDVLLPRWMWSLKIAAAVDAGNYRRLLRLLKCPDGVTDPATVPQDWHGFNRGVSELDRWLILSRCCLFPALPAIRIQMLRQMNKSFGKAEPVSGSNLAQLLYMTSSQDAVSFCELVGLPKRESDNKILFKAAPISVSRNASLKFCQREDDFVFGHFLQEDGCRVDDEGMAVPPEDFLRSLII